MQHFHVLLQTPRLPQMRHLALSFTSEMKVPKSFGQKSFWAQDLA